MSDKDRSKEELINELIELRKRNLELELCLKEKIQTELSSSFNNGLHHTKGRIYDEAIEYNGMNERIRLFPITKVKENTLNSMFHEISDNRLIRATTIEIIKHISYI